MTIDLTQDKKDEVCKRVEAWIKENNAFAGEIIMQSVVF